MKAYTYERVYEEGKISYPHQLHIPVGEGYHTLNGIPLRVRYETCNIFGVLQIVVFRSRRDFEAFLEIVS